MTLLLENGRLIYNRKIIAANVLLSGRKIEKITKKKISNSGKKINCRGKLILPGVIDPHVHFRTPGHEYKEDWFTGSCAALHGGVTTVIDMPNNNPSITTQGLLEKKRKIVKQKALVNYAFHFGCTPDNIREIEKAKNIKSLKIYMGSSTGNLLVDSLGRVEKVFETAKKRGLVCAVHAESETCIKLYAQQGKEKGWNKAYYHTLLRPHECAEVAVECAIELAKNIKNKLHICHTTTAKEVELISKAKRHLPISCEVTPHHLFLTQKDAKALGNYAKMNPPLRSRKDTAALWKALQSGRIDCVATDHAPHTKAEKEKNFWQAPAGVPGLETALPLMLDAANRGKIALNKIPEIMSENPARIFGIKGKGKIAQGYDADLTIVALKEVWKVKGEELFTKCKWSPFEGRKLKGKVDYTIVNGKLAYENSHINKKVRGMEIKF